MKIEVNITKVRFFVLIGLVVLTIGIVGVIAYNSGQDPAVFGHSGEELEISINNQIKDIQQAIDDGDFLSDTNDCFLQIAGICPNNPNTPTGWSPNCPQGYVKKGGVDPMGGTGVNWCRTAFSLCCLQ